MKKFNVGDVVTIKAYHYDGEYDKEYPIYNFCQIIDMKNNCYVLDLKYENEMGDYENILVCVFTNKSVNMCYDRYYQNYLKEKGFVDSIDDLDVYYFKLKEYIENKYTNVIIQRLYDILQLYVKNMVAKIKSKLGGNKAACAKLDAGVSELERTGNSSTLEKTLDEVCC